MAAMTRHGDNVVRFRPKRRTNARPWGKRFTFLIVALPMAAFAAVLVSPAGWPPGAAVELPRLGEEDREGARFSLCGVGVRINCVIDGDTFWYRGEKIRIADINTPEVSKPACAREAQLGAAATERLHSLLNEGAFTLEPIDRDRDQHGRLLRTVTRDGESVGAVLVTEGLAEEWRGYRGSWC